jgi:hypothetical protein
MATQGILSIVNKNNDVLVKVITGANGQKIMALKKWVYENKTSDPKTIFEAAKNLDVGGKESLVVQFGPKNFITETDDDLNILYVEKFNDPSFNPRWSCGLADYSEKIVF